MPVLVRYCNKCGIRISPLDLETGRAVEHKGGYYCANCAEELVVVAEVVEEEEAPERRKARNGKRPLAPVIKRPVHVDPDKVPQRHAVKERAHHEEPARAEYQKPSESHLPIYLLIIAVFIVLVVIVVLANQKNGTRKPPKPAPRRTTTIEPPPPEPGRRTTTGVDTEAEQALRAELDSIIKHADEHPEELHAAIDRLNAFVRKPSLPMSVASDARLRLNTYTGKLRTRTAEDYKKLSVRIGVLLKEFKFAEALKALDGFSQTYASEDVLHDLDKERMRIYFEKGAHEEYLKTVKKVGTPGEDKSLAVLRSDLNELRKWLEQFPGTPHQEEFKELAASIEKYLKDRQQQHRDKVRKEYNEAAQRAKKLAEEGKYKEAALLLRSFAAKYPEEKALAKEAQITADLYDKQAAGAAKVPDKPKEPRYRLLFTGASPVSNLKYKYEAATMKQLADGDKCLSMPASGASIVKVEFEVENVPATLVLALEHASVKPQRGKKKAELTIKLNGKNVAENYQVEDTFKVEPFNIRRFTKKGANTLEIILTRKAQSGYLLKKLGIAKILGDAFKPLGEKPEDNGGAGKQPQPQPADAGIFDGKSLTGWKTHGPGEWKVQDGVIIGKHTGKGREKDIGFVYPFSDKSKKWLDYRVSFEVWSNVAGGWQVGLRVREGVGGLVSGNLLNASDQFVDSKWWKIVLRLDGKNIYASVDGSDEFKMPRDEDLLPGTFAFGVKLGAVVKFRNIKFELVKTK